MTESKLGQLGAMWAQDGTSTFLNPSIPSPQSPPEVAPAGDGTEDLEEEDLASGSCPAPPATGDQPQATGGGILDEQDMDSLRRRFILTDLLQDLDLGKLRWLRRQFVLNGGAVSRPDFIRIMKRQRALPCGSETNADLPADAGGDGGDGDDFVAARLADLFQEIDVNGDKVLSFDEFSDFLVSIGLSQTRAEEQEHWQQLTAGSAADGVEPSLGSVRKATPVPKYERAQLEILDADGSRAPPTDSAEISCLRFIPELDHVLVSTAGQAPGSARLRVFRLAVAADGPSLKFVKEAVGHRGVVLDAVLYPEAGYVITSGVDERLLFFEVDAGYICRLETRLPAPAVKLCVHRHTNLLLAATTEGALVAFRLDSLRQAAIDAREKKKLGQGQAIQKRALDVVLEQAWTVAGAHSDMIPAMISLSDAHVCTGGLDGVVRLFDAKRGEKLLELRGHSKGIRGLAYHPGHHVLLSAGSDRDALAWTPLSKKDGPTGLLRGHHSSIVGVEVLGLGSPYALTAGSDGEFVVWDIRTFEGVHHFWVGQDAHLERGSAAEALPPKVRKQQEKPAAILRMERRAVESFCACSHGIILAATPRGRLLCFQSDKPANAWLADEHAIIGVAYVQRSETIVTASASSLRFWDASTGVLLRYVRRPCGQAELTAVALDPTQLHLALGDSEGAVNVVSCSNGALLRRCRSHTSTVSAAVYTDRGQLITASWDGHVAVHTVTQDPVFAASVDATARPEGMATTVEVLMSAYSPALGILVAAYADNTARIWSVAQERDHKTCLSMDPRERCTIRHERSVTAVCVLTPWLLACSADASGTLVIWQACPAAVQGQVLYRWPNLHVASRPAAVTSMQFLPDEGLLMTGDDTGEVKAWFMRNFFTHTGAKPGMPAPSRQREFRALQHWQAPFVLRKWQAHSTEVTVLQVIQEPRCLMTGSRDGQVRCWSASTGEYLGSLRQVRSKSNWRFPFDFGSRKATEQRLLAAVAQERREQQEKEESFEYKQKQQEQRRLEGAIAIHKIQAAARNRSGFDALPSEDLRQKGKSPFSGLSAAALRRKTKPSLSWSLPPGAKDRYKNISGKALRKAGIEPKSK